MNGVFRWQCLGILQSELNRTEFFYQYISQNEDNPDDIGQLPVRSVEVYNVETDSWEDMEPMKHRWVRQQQN